MHIRIGKQENGKPSPASSIKQIPYSASVLFVSPFHTYSHWIHWWLYISLWGICLNGTNVVLVRFEVFTPVTMKNAVFWDMTPHRSHVNRRSGGMYNLHLQGRKIRGWCSWWLQPPAHAAFSLVDFVYPEDGGDMSLQNVRSHKIYWARHPRRRHSKCSSCFHINNVTF
jgi:hypothetical protein